MRKRNADKGFTLVEVIIAVVILGIVFSPLLSNFIQSARLNQKARKELDATTMAQNIMEGMSAYSAEDIIKSLDSDTVSGTLPILPVGTSYAEYGEIDTAANRTIAIGSTDYYDSSTKQSLYSIVSVSNNSVGRDTYFAKEVLPNTYGSDPSGSTYSLYQFYIKDVELAGITAGTKYDVIVKLDTGGHGTYNGIDRAKVASINGTYDCVWQDTAEDRSDAIDIISNKNVGVAKTTISDAIQRTLYVDIGETTETDAFGNTTTDVTVKFKDRYDAGTYGDNSPLEVSKYSKKITSQDPRNVYIYFWPSYVSDAKKDKIVITNTLATNVNVYLIRMKVPATAYLPETSHTREEAYKADISVDGKVNVYTNMYGFTCCEAGDTTSYAHTYSDAMRESLITSTKSNGAVINKTLTELNNKNKLYNITLDVYESGAISSGLTNGSPDYDKRLASFTGGAIE